MMASFELGEDDQSAKNVAYGDNRTKRVECHQPRDTADHEQEAAGGGKPPQREEGLLSNFIHL